MKSLDLKLHLLIIILIKVIETLNVNLFTKKFIKNVYLLSNKFQDLLNKFSHTIALILNKKF